jgi:glyoxylase-like metal-dependent hydrolase (beta-lactamase superfamily II)
VLLPGVDRETEMDSQTTHTRPAKPFLGRGPSQSADGVDPDRRWMLTSAALSSLAIMTGLGPRPTAMATGTSRRFALGTFEITVFSDGHLVVPAPFLATNVDASAIQSALAIAGQQGERVQAPCNVTLIRTPSDFVLIDVGAGPHYAPTAGKLLANMEASGVDPKTITKVVYTHAHPDHIWGTLDDFDESPNFPNASYVLSAAEWNFWMADNTVSKLPPERRNFALGAKPNLSKVSDRVTTVIPGAEIVAGLRAVETAGHTAGHIAIEVSSGRETLLVVGDALTHPVISFAYPRWKPAGDHHDADQAILTRKKLLDRLATDHTPVIGSHLPWPGFGAACGGVGMRQGELQCHTQPNHSGAIRPASRACPKSSSSATTRIIIAARSNVST